MPSPLHSNHADMTRLLRGLLTQRERITVAAKWFEGRTRTNIELALRFGVGAAAIGMRLARALFKLANSPWPSAQALARRLSGRGKRRKSSPIQLSLVTV